MNLLRISKDILFFWYVDSLSKLFWKPALQGRFFFYTRDVFFIPATFAKRRGYKLTSRV